MVVQMKKCWLEDKFDAIVECIIIKLLNIP